MNLSHPPYTRYLLVGIVAFILLSCCGFGLATWRASTGYTTFMVAQHHELKAARSRWEARPFSHYRLIIEDHRAPPGGCRYTLEVQDEQVITILESGPSGLALQSCAPAPAVTDLFLWIEDELETRHGKCGSNGCACDGPMGVEAVYDAELGYPQQAHVRSLSQYRYRYPGSWNPIQFWVVPQREWSYGNTVLPDEIETWMHHSFRGTTQLCTLMGSIDPYIEIISLTPLQ